MEEGRKHCIKDAVEKFKLWRGLCGRSGWYDMDDASLFIFFESIYPPIEPKPLPNGLPTDEVLEKYLLKRGLDIPEENKLIILGVQLMRSLAEKEMIGFAEWTQRKEWAFSKIENLWWHYSELNMPHSKRKYYTTQQLLTLYREHKNTNTNEASTGE